MSDEGNPFLKDYMDKIDELIKDMMGVACEVAGFLEALYGEEYNVRNLIEFLWVFTAGNLLIHGVDINHYCKGLRLFYKYMKLKRSLRQIEMER
jgi:hypothetical protein